MSALYREISNIPNLTPNSLNSPGSAREHGPDLSGGAASRHACALKEPLGFAQVNHPFREWLFGSREPIMMSSPACRVYVS